jgi:hypothetical protein
LKKRLWESRSTPTLVTLATCTCKILAMSQYQSNRRAAGFMTL